MSRYLSDDESDLRAEFPRPRPRRVPSAFRSAGQVDERGLDDNEGPSLCPVHQEPLDPDGSCEMCESDDATEYADETEETEP